MRTHAFTLVLSYIYGLVALLDNIQSSFSSITISTETPRISETPLSTLLPLAMCYYSRDVGVLLLPLPQFHYVPKLQYGYVSIDQFSCEKTCCLSLEAKSISEAAKKECASCSRAAGE